MSEELAVMKKLITFSICFVLFLFFAVDNAVAQCSICTKTASQLGEGPAEGLNSGIIYLMATPLLIAGYIGFRWWRKEKQYLQSEEE